MEEQWAAIPGFSNYEISNLGKIERVGKTKRSSVKVCKDNNYIYASLSCGSHKSKQINVKRILDECFSDHIYKDDCNDDLEGEFWTDVVGWETSYEVSNLGRIRTKERVVSKRNGSTALTTCRIKKAYMDEDGYYRISLYQDGKTKLLGVHRVVAEAFIPNPDDLPQVNHKNGIKTDNRVENLEWVTNLDNMRHSIEAGLRDVTLNSRPVVRVEDNKHFSSIAELHRELGGSYNKLVHDLKCSDGQSVSIGGQHYMYERQQG